MNGPEGDESARQEQAGTTESAAADLSTSSQSPELAGSAAPGLVVGIGASAGGLEAFSELLRNLPADTGMAFVLVQHLDPNHESILADLLGNHTHMPVMQVHDDVPVKPDHVYVIPPNATMVIVEGILRLTRPLQDLSYRRRPIDAFFASLAENMLDRAIGVVLSGTASDGTLGLKAIKAEGGITFAQDATAQFDGMPRNAIAAGVVDFVLAPRIIAQELTALARQPAPRSKAGKMLDDSTTLDAILEMVHRKSGVDFQLYKPATISRRLARRMTMQKAETLADYRDVLRRDPGENDALFDDLLIKVTEFFRDAPVFEALKEKTFPAITNEFSENRPLRIWVAACSTGEEIYSIAISFLEFMEARGLSLPIVIFGTDASERAIQKARTGVYDDSAVANVSEERLRRFFTRSDSGYKINRNVRELCVFSRHILGVDPSLSRMDLVSCRNLLIYLGAALQGRVVDTLAYAVRPAGCLLVGRSENTSRLSEFFDPVDREHRIYARRPTVEAPAVRPIVGLAELLERAAPVPPNPASDRSATREAVVHSAVDRMLVSHYGPSGMVVDRDLKILEVRGNMDPYLQIKQGDGPVALMDSVRDDLAGDLRAAISEAHQQNTTIRLDEIQVRRDRAFHFVRINVIPISIPPSDRYSVILFEDLSPSIERTAQRVSSSVEVNINASEFDTPARHIQHLEQELIATSEYLHSTIEELRSSNEEAQSANEELHSNNEELQTTKEELQASNEELVTLNAELQSGNIELGSVNDVLINLLASINIPIVMVDSRLCIRRFTPAAESLFRLRSIDVGRPMSDFRLPINIPRLDEILKDVIGTLKIHEQEVEDTEGHCCYLMRIRPYRTGQGDNRIDGAVLLLTDVTELKRRADEIRRAEARYGLLFESARDGIVIVDEGSGEILDVNPHAEQLFGFRRQELVGQKLWEIEATRDTPGLHAALEQTRDQHAARFPDMSFKAKGGRTIQTEMIGNVFQEGNRSAIQLNIRDLTDRRQFERELQQTQKLESLGLLAGGVAHDFNNLLSGIIVNTDLVDLEMPVDDPSRTHLRAVKRASEQAAKLTQQLMDYAGRGRFLTEHIHLSELIGDVLPLIQTSIPKTVDVRLDLTPDLPLILADPGQIQQLVMNLIINGGEAIGAGNPGIVAVRTGERELTPEEVRAGFVSDALTPGRYVWLEVKDTGAGMDETTKAKIFDPFFTTKFTGRGLGLAAVSGILRTLRGAIRVYSTPGRGSTFYVLFPAAAPAVSPKQAKRVPKLRRASGTILVIDDEEVIRQSVRVALEKSGFEVLSAENGRAGVDLFEEQSGRISLVILDLTMPVMSGEQAFDLLRAIRSDVPILLASGYDETDAVERTAERHFAGFLQKPFDVNRLIEAVGSVLGLQDL